MLAMPGLRAFRLSPERVSGGVSCTADGVFVGDVPVLEKRGAWTVRPLDALNRELSSTYRLPIDLASKSRALALIADAFNRGDLALAAIATVQMQFPDPPALSKTESVAEVRRRAAELHYSALLKFWDPALHPRAGEPPNPGWFTPGSGAQASGAEASSPRASATASAADAAEVLPVSMQRKPWEKPEIIGGFGGGGGGFSTPRPDPQRPQLPFPGGLPRARPPEGPSAPPGESPEPSTPVETQQELDLPGGSSPESQPAPGTESEPEPATESEPAGNTGRGGRLGNATTRAQNAEIAAQLTDQGYTIVNGPGSGRGEEYIPGEGDDGGTYIDITAVNKGTGATVRIQTVDTYADGTPTQRELDAIARIKSAFPKDIVIPIPKRIAP